MRQVWMSPEEEIVRRHRRHRRILALTPQPWRNGELGSKGASPTPHANANAYARGATCITSELVLDWVLAPEHTLDMDSTQSRQHVAL